MSKNTPSPSEMTEEDYLHEQLRLLQTSYENAARPIVDRLVRIKSLRCHPSILILLSYLEAINPDLAISARRAIANVKGEA